MNYGSDLHANSIEGLEVAGMRKFKKKILTQSADLLLNYFSFKLGYLIYFEKCLTEYEHLFFPIQVILYLYFLMCQNCFQRAQMAVDVEKAPQNPQ